MSHVDQQVFLVPRSVHISPKYLNGVVIFFPTFPFRLRKIYYDAVPKTTNPSFLNINPSEQKVRQVRSKTSNFNGCIHLLYY